MEYYFYRCKFGGGKVLREGMGQATGIPESMQLDTVITNALIVDHSGIYKADIGIKDGNIVWIVSLDKFNHVVDSMMFMVV